MASGAVASVMACASGHGRAWEIHVVDGQQVHGPVPAPSEYLNYLHARLAAELDAEHSSTSLGWHEAKRRLVLALVERPHDPWLWARLAEAESALGHSEHAWAALAHTGPLRATQPWLSSIESSLSCSAKPEGARARSN